MIIVDKKIPVEAKAALSKIGNVVELETESITDDYLLGHPDIFFSKTNTGLIVAPNLPEKYKSILIENKINFSEGNSPVGKGYPACAPYNCVISDKYLIHKLAFTDKLLLEHNAELKKINVKQGMTRCSLLALKNRVAITSDKNIYSVLKQYEFDILYVDTKKILLPGMNYGLVGGTAGVNKDKVFLLGSLKYLPGGENVKAFLQSNNYKIIELYDGPLFDGGSILFI